MVLECETETTTEVIDANLRWTARERLFVDKMEQDLEKSESIQVEVTDLQHYFLGPEDAGICVEAFAESVRDEGEGEVEALRWLMQCVKSMEKVICGLHEIERSSVSIE